MLKNLLTVNLIRDYPKLSLIAYEALHEYIEVFDNEFVSFFKQCQRNKLIEKVHKNKQGAHETELSDNLMKRCKIVECGSLSRDEVIKFYVKKYRNNLLELARQSNRVQEKQENNGAENAVSVNQQEKDNKQIDRLIKKRKMLTAGEIVFIVDFLIDICKFYQVFDKHALTLGINLMPNFYQ